MQTNLKYINHLKMLKIKLHMQIKKNVNWYEKKKLNLNKFLYRSHFFLNT